MNKLKVLILLLLPILLFSCSSSENESGLAYEEDFERSTKGWGPRGSETIVVSSDTFKTGEQSLMITNRSATWNGPMKDLSTKIKGGRTYKIGAWVTFLEGTDSIPLNMSIQRSVNGGDDEFSTIGTTEMIKGEWSYIEAIYTVPKSEYISTINLYFETPYKADGDATEEDLITFYMDNMSIQKLPPLPPPEAETDIPALQDYFDFPIGAAIKPAYFNTENMYNGLLRHFDGFVFDNDMKMDAMQPVEGKFVYKQADKLIEYAEANNSTVRGHALLWHMQYPKWFFIDDSGNNVSKDVLLDRIETHIKTIVTHYKGKVDYWDVVNEVIADDGEMRNSPFLEIVGSDEFIERAFIAAHEADPDAKLFINDYAVCQSGPKQETYYALVKRLLDKGIPVHGVGFQSHINLTFPNISDIRNAIRRFADLGVEVQITELDLSIYKNPGDQEKRFSKDIELKQAYKYRALFNMYKEEAALGHISMVTLWGIADLDTWLSQYPIPGRKNYPLLFGRDLRAKASYWALVDTDKLGILIKRMDAIQTDTKVTTIDEEAWTYASDKEITDINGISKGRFKLLWDEDSLYVKAEVDDNTIDESDSITLYFEGRNKRGESLTADTVIVNIPRSEALVTTETGYSIFKVLDFPITARANRRYAFDVRVNDNEELFSYNDYRNTQDEQTINYSTVNLGKLSPMCSAFEGTVIVDGEIDALWEGIEATNIDVIAEGTTTEGSTFKAMWDQEWLYVLFDVKDNDINSDSNSPWEQDSVEVFIDQNNGKAAAYDSDDAQYRINYLNEISSNGGVPEEVLKGTKMTDTGYIVELAIPISKFYLIQKNILGFDVQINNADESGKRVGMRNWVNDTNLGYQDPSGFGVIRLE